MKRSPTPISMGKLRWKDKTPAERSAHAKMMVEARERNRSSHSDTSANE